jgi:hypothetical protein
MSKIRYVSVAHEGQTHEKQAAAIHCPACGYSHVMGIGPHYRGHTWSFNGDDERPVFSPSLLMRQTMWHPPVTPANYKEFEANPWPQEQREYVCHSFIGCNGAQPGEIIFLGDSTHHLAGQVVPLPEIPE